ncbi:MAG: hypothetical protein V3V15_03730 [Sphingorhabdus sp.]
MQIEPATLGEALMMQPAWLLIWLGFLGAANLGAVLFIVGRKDGKWIFRIEALAILLAFMAAGSFMEYLYGQHGYVRLLGLAHIVFWTPVYAWIWFKRRQLHPPSESLFGKFLVFYLLIDGISLVIDVIDVIRHFAGV